MKPRAPLVDFAGTHAELGFTEVVTTGRSLILARPTYGSESSARDMCRKLHAAPLQVDWGRTGGWELNPTDSNR
ncbi:hypothetical protein GCM10010095_18660 [Streptomyces anthocyanicus]|nr:hypothetical protein GCM10010095_18660 [Streptomyces anthocyanicus]